MVHILTVQDYHDFIDCNGISSCDTFIAWREYRIESTDTACINKNKFSEYLLPYGCSKNESAGATCTEQQLLVKFGQMVIVMLVQIDPQRPYWNSR